MTVSPSITLAGGIKAPRRRFSSGTAAPGAFSPAHAAFIALIEALADAVEAEGLRVSGAAWDMAYGAPEVRAQIALNDVVGAARQAGDAPVVIASDRRLVFAARFIAAALDVVAGADRENILHFMSANQPLWCNAAPGLVARRVDALIEQAFRRLDQLSALQRDAGLPLPASDLDALFDAPLC
ncbi:hypothetical protein [Paenirhodobacter sp. CAU 1674]|uniref:hypothetical protein n=1 Tax=Paenirhodobacter sp. CAU 1674 TaxID=3032596 RepID=UPI0023DC746A|nr:hypothetical protein [Paenirhodobacter sp. CAU 1674]MDF2143267.1 hypothetical protein [Paenirhodobacter sp. CAU 1674]